ncbi:adenylate/guanylate cyclase domain-containing protein [Thermodesulfobacteriota bacterium]
MTEKRVKRKLSAILSADAVDYSRLMGEDEVSTVRTLESYRAIMSDLIEQFRGRVVDSPGDNLLAEFSSVVDAVQCAVEIHEVIRAKNEELPEDRKMFFRIGVNLGDVIEEGDRIYGDGVNIAARLEGLAEAGGICISGSAHEQIKNKLALGYEYIGEHSVKNIAEPLKVYRVPVGPKALIIKKEEKNKTKLKKQSTAQSSRDKIEENGLRKTLIWVLTVILISIIFGVAIWNTRKPEPPRLTRFYHELEWPEGHIFFPGTLIFAVSPDGTQVVYSLGLFAPKDISLSKTAMGGLYSLSFSELDARIIVGTEGKGINSPFFSPDGKWIAYFSDNKLWKIPALGGAPIPLCDIATGIGIPYTSNRGYAGNWVGDKIIFSGDKTPGVMQISDNGGTPKQLFEKENEWAFLFPQLLPNGKSVLFTKIENYQNIFITVRSLETGETKQIIPGYKARYLPTGHLIYSTSSDQLENYSGNLFAVPFDIDKLEATGEPVLMIENVHNKGASYAISDSGTLAYHQGVIPPAITLETSLAWVDRDGKVEQFNAPPRSYGSPKISPDGNQVAFAIHEKIIQNNEEKWINEIWIWDEVRKTLSKITSDKGYNSAPIWTPDGERIVYISAGGIFWRPANGTGEPEKLVSDPDRRILSLSSFSNDGKYLVMTEMVVEENADMPTSIRNVDISILSMEDGHKRIPLLQTEDVELNPKISPDNQYIAYTSYETGQGEIYVRPFPDVEKGKWQISQGGGTNPLWSSDERELFYISSDGAVMAVDIETKPTFDHGTPRILFHNEYNIMAPWDIHPDGKRFLLSVGEDIEFDEFDLDSPTKINIVLNWFEELKERVPVD